MLERFVYQRFQAYYQWLWGATVSKAGKIRAKRAGTCYVYAILNSGEYATVKVTVL